MITNGIICKYFYFNFRSNPQPQIVRYETKEVQPPADVLARMAGVFGVTIDYLLFGDTNEKIWQTLKDAEMIKQFEKIDQLPEDEKATIL